VKQARKLRPRRPFVACTVLLIFFAAGTTAQPPAFELESEPASSAHFAAGSDAFERHDYRRALAEFQAAIAAGSDAAAAHYNVAVCRYRLGDYEGAADAFRALARRFPAMRNLADYNLGLALTRQERIGQARTAFERAQAGGDEQIAALARAMLARLPAEAAPRASAWTGLVDLAVGHDDNVALVDEASLPAERSTDSALGEILGYLSGPLRAGGPWRLDASAYLLTHRDADEFDQRGVYVAGLYERRVNGWRFGVGPHYGRTTLAGDDFEQRSGVSIDVRYTLDRSRVTLGMQWTHDDIDALEPQFAYLDGRQDELKLVLDRALPAGRMMLDYRRDSHDRADPSVSADRDRYGLRYRRSMNAVWAGELVYEYRVSDYDRLAVPRREKRHQVGFEVTRSFSSDWQYAVQYRYADNDSSDPIYTYERHRLTVGLNKVF
jgi:Tetratricopeptide repeat